MCLWNVINLHHISSQIVVKSDFYDFKATFLSSFLVLSYQCSSEYALIVWCISSHTVFFNHILSKSTALYTFSHVIELSESRLFSTFSWNSPHIKILFDTDCSLELKILLILGPFFEKIWKLTVAAQYYVCWNSMRSGKSDVCIENSHEVFVVLCFS